MDGIPPEDYQNHIDKMSGAGPSKKRHLDSQQPQETVQQSYNAASGLSAPNSSVIPPARPPAPTGLYSTVSLVNPMNPLAGRPNSVYTAPPVMNPPRFPMVPNMYRPPVTPYFRPQISYQNGQPRPNMNQYIPNWQKGNIARPPPNLSASFPTTNPIPGAPAMPAAPVGVIPPMTGSPPPNPNANSGIPGFGSTNASVSATPVNASSMIGNIPPKLPSSNATPLTTISPITAKPPSLPTTSTEQTYTESTKIETLPNSNLSTSTATVSTLPKENDNQTNRIESKSNTNNESINNLSLNSGTNATIQVISSNKVSEFILVYSDNDVTVEEKRANHIKYKYTPK